MDSSILTICSIGLLGLCLSVMVRQFNKEISLLISFGISLTLVLFSVQQIREIYIFLSSYISKISNGPQYVSILIKVIITAYAADFTSQLCRDAGETSIASKVELAGKLIICIITLPIIISVMELISRLMSL